MCVCDCQRQFVMNFLLCQWQSCDANCFDGKSSNNWFRWSNTYASNTAMDKKNMQTWHWPMVVATIVCARHPYPKCGMATAGQAAVWCYLHFRSYAGHNSILIVRLFRLHFYSRISCADVALPPPWYACGCCVQYSTTFASNSTSLVSIRFNAESSRFVWSNRESLLWETLATEGWYRISMERMGKLVDYGGEGMRGRKREAWWNPRYLICVFAHIMFYETTVINRWDGLISDAAASECGRQFMDECLNWNWCLFEC